MDSYSFRPCIIIPAFNHAQTLARTVQRLNEFNVSCLIVNDGSTDETAQVLNTLTSQYPWLNFIELSRNSGKGAAVTAGFAWAATQGFTHAIQVDADGQHTLEDIPLFLEAGRKSPDCLILGSPQFDESAPLIRRWSRKLTNWLIWFETRSLAVADGLCGFRLYPIKQTVELLNKGIVGQRMDFDVDIVVRLVWAGVKIQNIKTKVIYPTGGISHFHYFKDNLSMIRLHLGLLREMWRNHKRARSRWERMSERGSMLALRLVKVLYKILGRNGCRIVARPIVLYFALMSSKARKASRYYLQRVIGTPITFKQIFQHFCEFGYSIVDKLAVWQGDIKEADMTWNNHDALRTVLQSGKGAVVLGAHLGTIEILRSIAELFPYTKVNALMYLKHATRFNKILEEINPSALVRIIPIDTVSPETILILRERVQQGEVVALLADRVTPGSPDRKVYVPFLGYPAPFPEGPFVLSSMLECPVCLAFCMRSSTKGYEVFFEPFSEKLQFPRATRRESLRSEISRYAQRLEYYCKQYPFQWFNFYDFWEDFYGAPKALPTKVKVSE